jgi:hypothetical protein
VRVEVAADAAADPCRAFAIDAHVTKHLAAERAALLDMDVETAVDAAGAGRATAVAAEAGVTGNGVLLGHDPIHPA